MIYISILIFNTYNNNNMYRYNRSELLTINTFVTLETEITQTVRGYV